MQNAPPGMPNVFMLDIPGSAAAGSHGSIEAATGHRDRARDSLVGGRAADLGEWRARGEAGTAGVGPPVPANALGDHGGGRPRETEILSGAWWNGQSGSAAGLRIGRSGAHSAPESGHAARLERLGTHAALQAGVHRADRFRAHDGALRIHLQSRQPGWLAGHLLRQRPREAARRGGGAARGLREDADHHGDQHGGRAGDRAAGSGSDCPGGAFRFGVHHLGRRDHSGVERGRDALRPRARSGHPENAGRHAAACGGDLFGRVPGAGRGGGIARQRAGHRFHRIGGETPAEGGVPSRSGGRSVLHRADALVAVAAGWLASYRILGQKPLEVLRDE